MTNMTTDQWVMLGKVFMSLLPLWVAAQTLRCLIVISEHTARWSPVRRNAVLVSAILATVFFLFWLTVAALEIWR